MVIMVIGVLILSIAKGADLITKYRLNNAQNVSRNSVVPATDGLVLWLEPSFKESLGTTLSDGDKVTNWYSVNPQSIKVNFSQSVAANKPTFKQKAIGGLPAIDFTSSVSALNATNLPLSASYTIFAVFNPLALGVSNREIISIFNDADGNFTNASAKNGVLLELNAGVNMRTLHRANPMASTGGDSNVTAASPFVSNKDYILSYVRNFSNATQSVWLNNSVVIGAGSAVSSPAVTKGDFELLPLSASLGSFNDALSNSFGGYISEVIIFNRALTQDEIDDIEEYLSKKYSIKLN